MPTQPPRKVGRAESGLDTQKDPRARVRIEAINRAEVVGLYLLVNFCRGFAHPLVGQGARIHDKSQNFTSFNRPRVGQGCVKPGRDMHRTIVLGNT